MITIARQKKYVKSPIGIDVLNKGSWRFIMINMPEILGNINDLRAALEHEKRHVWQLIKILTTTSKTSPLQGEVFKCTAFMKNITKVGDWYRWRLEVDAIKWQKQTNSKIYQQSSANYKQDFVHNYLIRSETLYDAQLALIPDFEFLSTLPFILR